jgi:hypothetical protein
MKRVIGDLLLQLVFELIKACGPDLLQAMNALGHMMSYPVTLPIVPLGM